MLTPSLLALTLAGAPLSFDDGEFLGWTKDGDFIAWTGTIRYAASEPKRLARVAQVRNVVLATEESFELEAGPLDGGAVKPGPDVPRWERWKADHPLVKLPTLDGATAVVKADGKPTLAFGGTGKAVTLELEAGKAGLTHRAKSLVAEYAGKKLGATAVSTFFDPTGRRVVFALRVQAPPGEPTTTELIEVPVAPTAFVWTKPGASAEARREHELRLERAGFVASGGDEAAKAATGVTVTGDTASFSAAQAVAAALGGKASKAKVNRQLGDVYVFFDCAP